jgi:DNA polymerase/3'-5' exonuclease PolX
MNLQSANLIATDILTKLSPACERCEIAGSVRRKKRDDIKDIEFVCVPKISPVTNLFGERQYDHVALEHVITRLGYIYTAGPRLKKVRVNGVNVEIYIVYPPSQWGVIYTLRTGPRDFSQWCVTQRNLGGQLPSHLYVMAGAVWLGGARTMQDDGSWIWQGGEIIPMPEERDFFSVLELEWIPPEKRKAQWRRR